MRLGDFPYRRVRVAWLWCPRRRGDYSVERMIARLGPNASLDAVLLAVTVTCRWPKAWGKRGLPQYVPWRRAYPQDLGSDRPPDRQT